MRRALICWIAATATLLACHAAPALRSAGPASLSLTVGGRGDARVHFVVATLPKSDSAIVKAVEDSLGLKFQSVEWDKDEGKQVVAFDTVGYASLGRTNLIVQGQFDLRAISQEMALLNVPKFTFSVTHPACGFSRCSLGGASSHPEYPIVEYLAEFAPAQPPQPIHLEFGYTLRQLLNVCLPASALTVLLTGGHVFVLAKFNRAQTARPTGIVWMSALSWAACTVFIYLFRVDFLWWHAAGLDSYGARLGAVALFSCGALGGVRLVGANLARRASPRTGPQNPRLDASSLVIVAGPTLLASAGLLALRQLNYPSTAQWLASAVAVLGCSMGVSLWADSSERRLRARHEAVAFAAIVLTPAFWIYLIREWAFDDSSRPLAYLGALVATVVVAGVGERCTGIKTGPPASFRRSAIGFVLAFGAALWTARLLRFRFDLTAGDEGWGYILISAVSAAFCLFILRRPQKAKRAA